MVRHTENWQEEKLGDEKNQEPTADEPKEPQGNEPTADEPQGIDYDKLASILDGRQRANEESVLKGYFKEQGLTGEEMAQAIASFKEAQAAKAPDVAGMQASIAELQSQIEAAQKAADVAKVENAVIVEATKLGIDPKAIPYLSRMADLTAVIQDGAVVPERVAEALGKVLDDIPALKPTAQQQAGFRIGGEGDKSQSGNADNDKLKAIFGVK